MGNSARQKKNLAFFNMNIFSYTPFHNFQCHISFSHIKELLSFFQVIVFALVWPSNIKYLPNDYYINMLFLQINMTVYLFNKCKFINLQNRCNTFNCVLCIILLHTGGKKNFSLSSTHFPTLYCIGSFASGGMYAIAMVYVVFYL